MRYINLDNYVEIYSETNSLVLINLDLLVNRLKMDSPEYFVDPNTKNVFSLGRIHSAIKFTKENLGYNNVFEAPKLGIEGNKLGVIDGRHRIAAAKKIGYTHIYVDIPNKYKEVLFDLTKSN